MPKVYRFTTRAAIPYRIGVIVGEGEEFWQAATDKLMEHAADAVTKYNEQAYFDRGFVELVAEFLDDEKGWEKAEKLAEDIEEYLS